jgi:hypothetical protein
MTISSKLARCFLALSLLLAPALLHAQAGPPFQTDDPTPVDLGHYEFYVFGAADGTPVTMASTGPAFEFNWGAIPNVQLHTILPFGSVEPSNKALYAPNGAGPTAFGLTDMEFGLKWGFLHQTPHRPQIGSFTMLELPTGNSNKGLGVGRVWYKLPLWAEKEFGPWSLVGGAGYTLVHQTGLASFPYGGVLLKRTLSDRLELSAEVFSHAAEGPAAPQTQASTMVDAGGYYHFHSPGLQLLFAYGHSIAGQTENYAYLGLYKTWGKDKAGAKDAAPASPTSADALLSHHQR